MKRVVSTYGFLFALDLSLLFAGCASYSIKSPDGKTTLSGSMLNGAASISSGPGCTPTSPGAPSLAPALPALPPTLMVQKQVCEPGGGGCRMALIQADAAAPVCNTVVVNVHGTDITDYFKWALAGGAMGFLLAQ